MELDNLVFGNNVILSNIFSHLDYSTFKAARQVAVFWNEIGNLQLKSFSLQLQLLLSDSEKVLSEKVQFLQHFKIKKIYLSNGKYNQLYQQKWEPLENLLTQFGPQILRVELKFFLGFNEAKIISLFKSVLKQCCSAIELRMGFELLYSHQEIEESHKNYSIRKLCFSKPNVPQRCFRNLIKLFPNLEEIECDDVQTINEFLGEVYPPQQLKKVKVFKISNPKRKSKLCATNVKRFPHLLNLVKLEVLDLHIDNYDSYYPHQLYHTFKATLEDFSAGLILNRGIDLTFTKMDRLRSLSLKFETKGKENFKILFKSGHGLETKNFPSLKELKMGLGLNLKSENFITDNFGSLINDGVSKLVFIFPSNEDLDKFCGLATKKLLQSFPNAQLKFGHYLP